MTPAQKTLARKSGECRTCARIFDSFRTYKIPLKKVVEQFFLLSHCTVYDDVHSHNFLPVAVNCKNS